MIEINNVKLNYINYGNKEKDTLVFLHGWGQNIDMMKPVADPFKDNFNILIIDFPGHGESSEPTYDWQLIDFVNMLRELFEKLNIKNPILIGHSFGGKVSILYASMYETKKLVLLASPYKQEIKKLSTKTKILKQLKKVPGLNKFEEFAKKHIGSTDYKNASVTMRKILVNHVNTDLSSMVRKIKCPTLIIWGTNDDTVSIDEAYELESMIRDSGVVVYEGCTHFAYIERLGQTISVLNSFLGGK